MKFIFVGLLLSGLSLVLCSVGLSIPHWYYFYTRNNLFLLELYYGLWEYCIGNGLTSGTKCYFFYDKSISSNIRTEVKAVEGLEILGVAAIAVAIVLVSFNILRKKGTSIFLKIAGVVAFGAGLLMIIGAGTFMTSGQVRHQLDTIVQNIKMFMNVDVVFKPHAGFCLCLVSGFISFAAGILFCLSKEK